MHVAFLTTSVSRRSGGLFVLMRGLGETLVAQGLELTVLGVADAHTAEDLADWGALDVRVHAPRPPGGFGYGIGYARTLESLHADLIHHHGLWQYHAFAGQRWCRRHARPWVISPQGMLDPWALANSRWKKRLAAAAFQSAHLRDAAVLHAVSPPEVTAIRAYGLRAPIALVSNGIDYPAPRVDAAPPWAHTPAAGRPVVLFLGRLHPKKGLSELVDGWQRLRQQAGGRSDWALVIAGWDQGGFRARLEAQVTAHGLGNDICFVGPLHGAAKAAAFQHASAFILPSFSEGMPAAVLEAWAYGLPVLMTPACNIPEGFAANAALRIDSTPDGIATGLSDMIRATAAERTALGQRGEALVRDTFAWDVLAARMRAVYAWVLGAGPRPEWVQS